MAPIDDPETILGRPSWDVGRDEGGGLSCGSSEDPYMGRPGTHVYMWNLYPIPALPAAAPGEGFLMAKHRMTFANATICPFPVVPPV